MGHDVQIGDIVHFVLDDGPSAGQHRPALVVHVWSDDLLQLQVFPDSDAAGTFNDKLPVPYWRTSVKLDRSAEEHGTWHPKELIHAR